MIITDATTEKVFAVATEEDGSLRIFGVDDAGKDWADWVDQKTKGRGTLQSILPTVGYAMRIEGPKPLTRQLRASLSELLPKVREDVRLELVEGRVKMTQEKSLPISPSARYLADDLVKSLSRQPIAATGRANHQNVVNFKAKAFFIDTYHASIAYEVKRARAMWDPNLGPDGGWRCPEGTRFGGYITDEWGRNCGLGVTRRIVNAITSVGQGATNFSGRRGGRRKPEGLGPSLRDTTGEGANEPDAPSAEGQVPTVDDFDMELVDLEAGSPEARRERRRRGRDKRRQEQDERYQRRLSNSRVARFIQTLDDVLEYGRTLDDDEREELIAEGRERRDRIRDALIEQNMRDLADQLDLGWGRDPERDGEGAERTPRRPRRPRGPEREVIPRQPRPDRAPRPDRPPRPDRAPRPDRPSDPGDYPLPDRPDTPETRVDKDGRRWIWQMVQPAQYGGRGAIYDWVPDLSDRNWNGIPRWEAGTPDFGDGDERSSDSELPFPIPDSITPTFMPDVRDRDRELPEESPPESIEGDPTLYGNTYDGLLRRYENDEAKWRRVRQAFDATQDIHQSRRTRDEREISEALNGTLTERIRRGEIPLAVEGSPTDGDAIDQSVDLYLLAMRDRLIRNFEMLAIQMETEGGEDEMLARVRSFEGQLHVARFAADVDEIQRRIQNVEEVLYQRAIDPETDVPSNVTLGAMFDPTRQVIWNRGQSPRLETQRAVIENAINNPKDLENLDAAIRRLDDRIDLLDAEIAKKDEPWTERVGKQVERNELDKIRSDAKVARRRIAEVVRSAEESDNQETDGDDGSATSDLSPEVRANVKRARMTRRAFYADLLKGWEETPPEAPLKILARHRTVQRDLVSKVEEEQELLEYNAALGDSAELRRGRLELSKAYQEEHKKFLDDLSELSDRMGWTATPSPDPTFRISDYAAHRYIVDAIKTDDIEKIADAFSVVPPDIEKEISSDPDLERAATNRRVVEYDIEVLQSAIQAYGDENEESLAAFLQQERYHREMAKSHLKAGSVMGGDASEFAMADFHEDMALRYAGLMSRHRAKAAQSEEEAPDAPAVQRPALSAEEADKYGDATTKIEDHLTEMQERIEEVANNLFNPPNMNIRRTRRQSNNVAFAHLSSAAMRQEFTALEYEGMAARLSEGKRLFEYEREKVLRDLRSAGVDAEQFSNEMLINALLDLASAERDMAARSVESMGAYLDSPELSRAEMRVARSKFAKRYFDQARRRRNLLRSYLDQAYGGRTPWRESVDVTELLDEIRSLDEDDDDDMQRREEIVAVLEDWVQSAFTLGPFEGRDGIEFTTSAQLDTDSLSEGKMEVSGFIRAAKGGGRQDTVGSFTRTITSGNISNDSMALNDHSVRNSGFQGVFNPHVWLWASNAGINEVIVSAGDQGPYVWGRVGFRGGTDKANIRDAMTDALEEFDSGDKDGIIRTDLDAQMVRYLLHLMEAGVDIELPEFIVATSDYSDFSGMDRDDREQEVFDWWINNVPFSDGAIDLWGEYYEEMYGA